MGSGSSYSHDRTSPRKRLVQREAANVGALIDVIPIPLLDSEHAPSLEAFLLPVCGRRRGAPSSEIRLVILRAQRRSLNTMMGHRAGERRQFVKADNLGVLLGHANAIADRIAELVRRWAHRSLSRLVRVSDLLACQNCEIRGRKRRRLLDREGSMFV